MTVRPERRSASACCLPSGSGSASRAPAPPLASDSSSSRGGTSTTPRRLNTDPEIIEQLGFIASDLRSCPPLLAHVSRRAASAGPGILYRTSQVVVASQGSVSVPSHPLQSRTSLEPARRYRRRPKPTAVATLPASRSSAGEGFLRRDQQQRQLGSATQRSLIPGHVAVNVVEHGQDQTVDQELAEQEQRLADSAATRSPERNTCTSP